MVTHPGTNRARRGLTSFMRRTPLTTTPRRQPIFAVNTAVMVLFGSDRPRRSSERERTTYERLFEHILRTSEYSVIPGWPNGTTRVEFGFTVLCAEMDRFNGQLKTHAWNFLVRKLTTIFSVGSLKLKF